MEEQPNRFVEESLNGSHSDATTILSFYVSNEKSSAEAAN